MPKVPSFNGLNNVTDPLRLGLSWLVQADNVDVTDTGALKKRNGYILRTAGAITSAYSTLDFTRLYLVKQGQLLTAEGAVLATGLSGAPMHWCEVNGQVFFNNGTDSGIIQPDHSVLPWRDSTLTELKFLGADGKEQSALLDPLPFDIDVIQHWRGRIYAAQYMASEDQTVIWFSQPLGFHLFSLDTDFILVPGCASMLAPHDDVLIIGTDQRIYAYNGESLKQLAPYGVVPGQHWSQDDQRILFWSTRGLCAALPFSNLTEKTVSVAPGVSAGGAIVQIDGQKRYVVALQQGGTSFNSIL